MNGFLMHSQNTQRRIKDNNLHQTEECGLMQGIVVKDTQIKLPRPNDIVKHDKTVAISLFPNWPNGGVKAFLLYTLWQT